jgi:hypothetical protein
METEKAKKTKKKAEKSESLKKTKEGGERKRTKGTKNKAMKAKTSTKEVIRVNDVRELVNYCKQHFGRKPFQGASIDFHPKKPAYVYIPDDNSVTKIETQKLLDFLKEKGVQRVLIDALNKKRLPTLVRLCEAGFEVFVLRRTYAIEQLRRELRRQNVEVPKSDRFDAVLLAFTSPKKWTKVDPRFLKAWEAMVEWRNAEASFRAEQQRYDANNSEGPKEDEEDEELRRIKELIRTKLEEVQRLLEEVQKLEAKFFVRKIQMIYPEVDFDKDFEEFGIKDDDIAKAYYCEALLEAMNCNSVAGYLMKSGIGVTGSPPAKQRKKPFVHDGALNRALVQLTLKVHRLDPYKDEDRKKVKPKARKLAKKIWKRTRKIKKEIEGGRVGEALGPAPLEERGFGRYHPRPSGGASCESRSNAHIIRSQAPDTRPTDNHTAVT